MADLKNPPPAESSVLSERDDQLLKYLALVAAVLQRQVNPEEPPKKKTFWGAFREPSVVAALITVLIGGIAATAITGIIQWRAGVREFNQSQMAKTRDFEQAWLKSRGDQALVSYKEYLDQEQGLIRRTYSLIGSAVSASDRLVGLTKASWRQRFVGQDLVAVRAQMRDIRNNYNQTNAKWHSEGEELGLLMGYFHPSQPKVTSSWKSVQESVTNYLECAQDWHERHPPNKPTPTNEEADGACKPKYDALMASLAELTSSLESSRRYAWTGWESPQEIKALLEGSKNSSGGPSWLWLFF